MAMVWAHLMQKRWLVGVNLFIGFFLLAVIFGYSPTGRLPGIIRWSDIRGFQSYRDTISCSPKTNVVFLKTHKCASSSVQNILLRNAHQKNLTVAIPVQSKTHILSKLKPFRRDMIAGAPWENLGYNIICHHMIFSESEVARVMPSDSLYISIVRNPVSLFESMYEYSKLESFYKMDIEEYARATKNRTLMSKVRVRANGIGRNPMLYDFGVNPRLFSSHRAIEDSIKKIDSRFDFVMVAEYFDESIVILRHILCWELDDVISLTVNARMPSYKKNLTEEAVTNLRHWNWGDQMLYNHFFEKFQRAVEEFGRDRMEREVRELRKRRQEWFTNCVEETVEAKNLTAYKIWSYKVVGFKLKTNNTDETCADLVKPETYFTNEIRQHQIIRALYKGSTRTISLYRMLDLSKLKGKELENARRVIREYIKQKRLKSPLLRLRTFGRKLKFLSKD